MKICSRLPVDRFTEGTLWVEDDTGATVFGPVRARGEADNSGAKAHGNVQENPTRAYGDHPYGVYRVIRIVEEPKPIRSYGPVFIAIQPVSGEAWEARQNGRTGFGIHGGALHPDGRLRETFGCLRLDDQDVQDLAGLIDVEEAAGREVFYEAAEA